MKSLAIALVILVVGCSAPTAPVPRQIHRPAIQYAPAGPDTVSR